MNITESYKKHRIFNEIDFMMESYEFISTSSSSFFQDGVSATANIDSIIYSSLKNTLESIKTLLEIGKINDGFGLVRKYFEGVIIDVYKTVYIREKYDFFKTPYADMIEKWYKGEKSLPPYKNMISYLNRAKSLDNIRQYFDISENGYYNGIKDKCNDNLHYNKFVYMLLNNSDYYFKGRESYLSLILSCIANIFELHIACIFLLHPEYLTSTDYIDSLECGETPIEGSQNWVSPFGENLFNKLWKNKPEIAKCIKDNTFLIFEDGR